MKETFPEPIHVVTRGADGTSTTFGPELDVDTWIDFVMVRGTTAHMEIGDFEYEVRSKLNIGRTFLRRSPVRITLDGPGVLHLYGHVAPGMQS